uniref:Lanosterol 14-alpha-demethylase (EC) n=1 Tax=Ganoderma boninense TaxID=34458 RepID=A0A5K1K3L4_9APHY|nr:Putative lanosterol 14-alpha-demethylase (EC [Ganoderma boninense]
MGRSLLRLTARCHVSCTGAPTDVFPKHDSPAAGTDPAQRDNFGYDPSSQDRCPFAAHTRKVNPRADLASKNISTENRRIIRRGIQFGPEVTADEATSGHTQHDRGLIFVAYSGSITNGFQFIQQILIMDCATCAVVGWANDTKFPIGKEPVVPGFDPIIGQNGADSARSRSMTGVKPDSTNESVSLPTDWVIPKGGEYFFSPSISALRSTFALA